jgi:hypothetical protein
VSGLGLRYCKQHPQEPLMLASNRSGTYWRCEHDSGCAYTENALPRAKRVVEVNGHAVQDRMKGGRSGVRTYGGSVVEKAVTDREADS